MSYSNQDKTSLIAVVIPVYKAENSLEELYDRLISSLEEITSAFEIVLVEDCGGDNSWKLITEIAEKDSRVKGIGLSRNFGQHHAITAGIDATDASWVVIMDCDLQDQPEEISKLYNKALEGYDFVLARREVRQDSYFKILTSRYFHKFLSFLSGLKMDPNVSNFGIYSSNVIDSVRLYKEQLRAFGLFLNMSGFDSATVDVNHAARKEGDSTYSFRKRWALAINIIVASSNKPLVLSIEFGFMGACFSILFIIYLVVRYFSTGIPVSGWTSTIASIYLVGSVLLMNMGFIGLYLGRVFDEVKRRPLYIVKNTVNLDQLEKKPISD